MSICVASAAGALTLVLDAFTLQWTHSVEHTIWREHWEVQGTHLQLREARVQGSGAGMDPGPDAVLRDGWWVWRPTSAPVEVLHLAASGATGEAWQLCTPPQGCRDLEALARPRGHASAAIEIRAGPCAAQRLAPAPVDPVPGDDAEAAAYGPRY